MSANSKLTITNLDFDSIKSSLKTYLKDQSQFADFDFEGSAINTLLDVLSYNTHYNAFYLNMVANEMFLDTAVLRKSVVSQAKALGYTPRSSTAALASVNVAITKANSDPTNSLTLPRFTQFTSDALNGISYNFVTLDEESAVASGNTFSFTNILLKEGSPAIKTFVVDNSTNPTQIFDLVDENIDTSTIQVIVQTSLTNILQTRFNLATDTTEVGANSNVFFLQEGQNGNYQIYFGDGVIGTKLSDGNVLTISYIVTNAEEANSLQTFKLQSNVLAGSTSNVTTVQTSSGGAPIEDITSIKFTAPKSYIAQNRAVTKDDYIALINKKYPYFDAVTIWGGEEETPPIYGKIFISAKPKNGFAVTELQKDYVINQIIKPISVLTVTPEFVDVDYNYLFLNFAVDYDSRQTTKSQNELGSTVIAAVGNYANLNLNTFNSEFRLSRLLRSVDDSEISILSSTAKVLVEKRFNPDLTKSQNYILKTGIELARGTNNDRLYSTPSFLIYDSGGIEREAFFEVTPESFSGIDSIHIINPGTGYTTAPTLLIIGDGIGANAYSVIVNGRIQSVVIDNKGSGYTTATVTAIDGAGRQATLTPVLQGRTGTLRTYYYDSNNNKIVLNDAAGSVDFVNGNIYLNDFNPISVSDPFGVLRIRVAPNTFSFGSDKSKIVTLDTNDPNAITVQLRNVNAL